MLRGLALVALLVTSGAAGAAPSSWTIRASATFERLGPWWISNAATYAEAVGALGPASSCRLHAGDPTWAAASWRTLGVRVELRTYGGLPSRTTGCAAPRFIHVHAVHVTGARWRTSFGLRVGDSVARLRDLYPAAAARPALEGWYRRGYWLVTKRTTCAIGVCGIRSVTAARLVAEVRNRRVAAFVLVVGAEGE